MGEHKIALFDFLVTWKTGFHERVVNCLPVVVEMTKPPTAGRGVLL
jgi:hypothetical protein